MLKVVYINDVVTTNRVSQVRDFSFSKKEVPMNIKNVKKNLSISFQNDALLQQAFTHSSYINEHPKQHLDDNERLEFLGDAVLELAVSDYLYKHYRQMNEGDLTKLRANIVCEESLYHFAELLQLHQYILLGKGEESTGGRNRQALLADVFEAFLGALYLDQGIEECQHFLEQQVFPYITDDAFSHVMDYKTKLQELVQQEKGHILQYKIVKESGPSHAKEFHAEVAVNNSYQTTGIGRSKKEAEQVAAKNMLVLLEKRQ